VVWSDVSIEHFNELTNSRFADHSVIKNGSVLRLNGLEWKVLMRTIFGYATGYHPVYLSEMKLTSYEIAALSLSIPEKENTLSKADIINFIPDQDGVTYRAVANARTLTWMLNRKDELQLKAKTAHGTACRYICHADIEPIDLIYSSITQKMYDSALRILSKNSVNDLAPYTLLLHGPSGTGKTAFARQLARASGSDILQLHFPQIHSKWIGETEKNLTNAFDEYDKKRKQLNRPLILLINEADGLMNKRVAVNTSNDVFSNQVQAQLLELMEQFKGILIATTNVLGNIDQAFHRRFLFKLKIDLPGEDERLKLWEQSALYEKVPEKWHDTIIRSAWSAAQLHLAEKKINYLSGTDELTESDIIYLLKEEGIIGASKAIGFT
jgi:hypothetical protein